SPSGLSCEVTMKRSFARRASTTALVSVGCIVVSVERREFIDVMRHADALLDRAIVDELEVRSPAQLELAIDPRLEHSGGALEGRESPVALLLGAEDAQPDLRMVEGTRRLDRRDGDEPDSRVLERRDRLGDDLLHRLVDPPHALGSAHGLTVQRGVTVLHLRGDQLAMPRAELERLAVEPALGLVEQPLGVARVPGDACERQRRSLPGVVV